MQATGADSYARPRRDLAQAYRPFTTTVYVRWAIMLKPAPHTALQTLRPWKFQGRSMGQNLELERVAERHDHLGTTTRGSVIRPEGYQPESRSQARRPGWGTAEERTRRGWLCRWHRAWDSSGRPDRRREFTTYTESRHFTTKRTGYHERSRRAHWRIEHVDDDAQAGSNQTQSPLTRRKEIYGPVV